MSAIPCPRCGAALDEQLRCPSCTNKHAPVKVPLKPRVRAADASEPRTSSAASSADSSLDDPTETMGAPGSQESAHAGAELPPPHAVFAPNADAAQIAALVGLERRFVEHLDGVVPLKEVAKAIGVNGMRAQFLAVSLLQRNLVSDTGVRAHEETLTLSDLDDL